MVIWLNCLSLKIYRINFFSFPWFSHYIPIQAWCFCFVKNLLFLLSFSPIPFSPIIFWLSPFSTLLSCLCKSLCSFFVSSMGEDCKMRVVEIQASTYFNDSSCKIDLYANMQPMVKISRVLEFTIVLIIMVCEYTHKCHALTLAWVSTRQSSNI